MSAIIFHYNSDTSALQKEAADCLNRYLQKYKGQAVLLLLSGGSALGLLDYIEVEHIDEQTTITVLDDRFSTDPTVNNFAQVVSTNFYQKAQPAGANFIDTRPQDDETQEQVVQRFEGALRTWKKNNPQGITLATLGIGADGHTSGMMVYPENRKLFADMFEGDAWIAGYDAQEKHEYPLRITTTITFLMKEIDIAVAYVAGSGKQDMMKKAVHGGIDFASQPSTVIQKMKHVELFTDFSVE